MFSWFVLISLKPNKNEFPWKSIENQNTYNEDTKLSWFEPFVINVYWIISKLWL